MSYLLNMNCTNQQYDDNYVHVEFFFLRLKLPYIYELIPEDQANTIAANVLWPLLLTWFNFNPSMDK